MTENAGLPHRPETSGQRRASTLKTLLNCRCPRCGGALPFLGLNRTRHNLVVGYRKSVPCAECGARLRLKRGKAATLRATLFIGAIFIASVVIATAVASFIHAALFFILSYLVLVNWILGIEIVDEGRGA